ncbi:hypothetical protein D3C86_1713200 [compost metagenome]
MGLGLLRIGSGMARGLRPRLMSWNWAVEAAPTVMVLLERKSPSRRSTGWESFTRTREELSTLRSASSRVNPLLRAYSLALTRACSSPKSRVQAPARAEASAAACSLVRW